MKRLQSLGAQDAPATFPLVMRGNGWGETRLKVTGHVCGMMPESNVDLSPIYRAAPPTPGPSPRGGEERGASVPFVKPSLDSVGLSAVSSLTLAALIPAPALAQEAEATTSLFTPTVILVGVAGLVIGGVIGFIRRRKEMKNDPR